MKEINCDVLVVGAGPAGLSAARAAAKQGKKVICIDKKEEIGVPVKCAEGVGSYLFDFLPFEIPKKYLDLRIKGIVFHSGDFEIKKNGDFWKGYSINRADFEKWLAGEAVSFGVNFFNNTKIIDLRYDSNLIINKAVINTPEEKIIINPKRVVAADGVHSDLLTRLDVYKKKYGSYAEVYSWEFSNLNLSYKNYEQVYFDEFTPKGYAYIFPKGGGNANIGVGGIYPKKPMSEYFGDFVSLKAVASQVSGAKKVIEKSKDAPFDYVLKKRQFGNVFAVGDSANDNFKPFVEGILPGIIIGDWVGNNLFSEFGVNPLQNLFDESDGLLKIIIELYSLPDYKKSCLVLCLLISGIISHNQISKVLKMSFSEILTLAKK